MSLHSGSSEKRRELGHAEITPNSVLNRVMPREPSETKLAALRREDQGKAKAHWLTPRVALRVVERQPRKPNDRRSGARTIHEENDHMGGEGRAPIMERASFR